MREYTEKLLEKLRESMAAVLPIVGLVLVLCFALVPVPSGILLCFLVGAVLLTVGMMFFNLGAELAMSPIGERVGPAMTKSRKLWVVLVLAFFLGVIITVSEPDLQVLAELVPSVPNEGLILFVAAGVGVFLAIAILRMLFGIALPVMLVGFYGLVFLLAFLVPEGFRAVAFDSGGVTTGPMTVPFIMALGVGISAVRNDRHAADDSFGLVGLCSIGPILAVMVLGMIYHPAEGNYELEAMKNIEDSMELAKQFLGGFPVYLKEMMISLFPIVLAFGLFQLFSERLPGKELKRIGIGMVYTYVGLVLFMTGANMGFMPAGRYLGQAMAGLPANWLIVPVGALMGYFIVKAEPAVYVLNHQVEEITDGAIPAKAMGISLSLGVAASVALSMVRVLTGLPILYFLVPGYGIAIGFSFFVPKIFTAIAFDSGGVASGPMTATFLLPFAQGACMAVGGNLVTDAFGVVAMVAMTPLITIQILGLVYRLKKQKNSVSRTTGNGLEYLEDDAIIEL